MIAPRTTEWMKSVAVAALGLAWLAWAPSSLSAAPLLFETTADRAAQTDLERLAEAEQRYWTDHGTYTVSFADLPGSFEPAKDTYVQVEIADEKNFRAIAMPRRSTSARVFALVAESGRGAVTELGDKEVSTYVLGAMNSIKRDQAVKLSLATVFTVGWLGLAIYGVVLHRRGEAGRWKGALPYFLGLIPLYVTLIFSTYIDENTYVGPFVLGAALLGAGAGALSMVFGVRALWQLVTQDEGFQLRRLALIGVLCAVLGIISPFYTFYPYLPWIGELTQRPASHRILPP